MDLLPVGERPAEIANPPVGSYEDSLLGELGPDRARRVEPRGAVGELQLGAVGQDDFHRAGG